MALFTQLLHRLAPAEKPATPPAAPRPEPESVRRLRPLLEHRHLLKVELDGQEHQSLLLAIDVERGLIWLDELFPRALTLQPGSELTVSHHRGGQLVQFSGPVVGWGPDMGLSGLALPLPQDVYTGPRRRWPRLAVYGWQPISARLAVPGLSPLSCEVLNLSAGGVRLAVTGDWRPFLRRRDLLPLCQFTVAPGLQVRCRVRVCDFGLSHRPWRQTRISLAFVDLAPDRQRQLASFVEQQLDLAFAVA